MNYTYDPTKIGEKGLDRMRFELGDCEVDGGEDTCALSDEEYTALISRADSEGRGWTFAKFLCVQGIVTRYANEADFSAGGGSISLSQRYERWKDMYDKLKKSFQYPVINKTERSTEDYFQFGMHDNVCSISDPFTGVPNR
jgi:hypothetical protein